MSDDTTPIADTEISPAGEVMQRLFPVDPTAWTSRLMGMQKRAVDRMFSGYSRTPERIVDKLEAQIVIRDEMMAKIEAAIAEAEAGGGKNVVLRYAIVDLLKSGRFDEEQEPL